MNEKDHSEDIDNVISFEIKQDFVTKAEKLTRGVDIINEMKQKAKCEVKNCVSVAVASTHQESECTQEE